MSKSLYLILTLLFVTHLVMAKRLQGITSMYTGTVNKCSRDDVLNREVLELSTGDIEKMECVRQCIRSSHCDAVVYQEFKNGSTSCATLSEVRPNLWSAPALSSSILCEMVHIKPCRNGGQLYEGVCLCQDGFAGQACEYANPNVCDVKWTTAATNANGSFMNNVSGSRELRNTNAKLAIRNNKLNVLSVMKSVNSGTDFPHTNRHWFFISFPSFEKESWNKFSPNPQRKYIHAMINGYVYQLSVSGTFGNYSLSNCTEYSSIISPRWTRYAVERKIPEDQDLLMNDIRNGIELLDSTMVNVSEEGGVIVAQLTDRFVYVTSNHSIPPIQVDFKHVLGQRMYKVGFNIHNGALSGSGEDDYSKLVYLNPCWIDVPRDDVHDQVSSLASGWKKLGTYLRIGKDVRIKSGSTYHTVLETINVGDTFAFIGLLAPYLSQTEPTPFTNGVYEIRSMITSSAFYQSCSHLVEQEQVIANSQSQLPHDVEWFVDTRTWSQVFAVFSNSSVAHGSLSDLVSGVIEGRDVRIWIKWLNSGVSRFLDTHMSSVTDDGKVSTESLVTWQTTIDSEVHLNQNCDLQYVLVTSDGHVEILQFNVHTPGVSEVQNDVLVTWFLT